MWPHGHLGVYPDQISGVNPANVMVHVHAIVQVPSRSTLYAVTM